MKNLADYPFYIRLLASPFAWIYAIINLFVHLPIFIAVWTNGMIDNIVMKEDES